MLARRMIFAKEVTRYSWQEIESKTSFNRICPMKALPAREVLDVIRQAMCGTIAISLHSSRTWCDVFCGEVGFMFGTYELVIYNDCNELDYIEAARAPDGRTGDFYDWTNSGGDPVAFLSDQECIELTELLKATRG